MYKDQLPAGAGRRASNEKQTSIVSSESKGGISEQPSQHGGQYKARRPSTVRHRSSNAKNISTEPKELGTLEGDLPLVGDGFVSCSGSLEGVTMMRDMDWR